MIGFELYTFFLCLFIFISLTALFSFLIIYIGRQRIRLIENGLEDEKIIKTIQSRIDKKAQKCSHFFGIAEKVLSIFVCAVLCILFVLVGISSSRGNGRVGAIPALKVVSSTSMAEKFENNTYLFKNNLNDQLQLFDVVMLHELPKEEEIKLYDIVVYEHISGALLMHRVVGIEEPNSAHPGERHFLLQGDAVHYPDTFPVRYEQMRSIYRGERIPNIGSFVFFMQSPAGIISLILIAISMVLMPIADTFIMKAEYTRVEFLVYKERLDEQALRFYKDGRTKLRIKAAMGEDRAARGIKLYGVQAPPKKEEDKDE